MSALLSVEQCGTWMHLEDIIAVSNEIELISEDIRYLKICDPPNLTINGTRPTEGLLGLIFVKFEKTEGADSISGREVVQYHPTNGAFSEGSVVFGVWNDPKHKPGYFGLTSDSN